MSYRSLRTKNTVSSRVLSLQVATTALVMAGIVVGSTTAAGAEPSTTRPTTTSTSASASATTPASAAADPSASQAPTSHDRLVPVTEKGYRLDSQEMSRLYGPGVFTQTALSNTVVGAAKSKFTIVSNRFRATESGELSFLRFYWPTGSGYASGTGGNIKITVVPDDGSSEHRPDLKAEPLAVTHYQPKLVDGKKQTKQELLSEIPIEQSKNALTSGQLYHVVLENVDPKPQDNFISSNNSITVKEDGKPARWLNSTDWSTLMGSRPANDNTADYHWDDLTRDGSGEKLLSPIMEVGLTTGKSIGMFDMESGSVHPERIYAASQNKPVREHFTPSTQKRVSGFSVASAASTGGALGWSIKQGDRVLASGQIEQPEANFTTHKLTRVVGSFTWYDVALPQDVVLEAGQSYDLEFRPVGNSVWQFGDHSNGSNYAVKWPAAFTESQAQHLQDGTWINTNHWDHTKPGGGTNWPVVLHVAP